MTRIVGLLGAAGAGKSLIASHLETKYGAVRYTLAKPLKQMVQRAFDLTDEQVYGTQAQKEAIDPRYNVSPRWLLQHIGTEGIRGTFGPDFWVDYLLDRVRKESPKLAVVDDVRFINESAKLMDAGASIWKIIRHNGQGAHASEQEWRVADHTIVIYNDGTVQDLLTMIDNLGYGLTT